MDKIKSVKLIKHFYSEFTYLPIGTPGLYIDNDEWRFIYGNDSHKFTEAYILEHKDWFKVELLETKKHKITIDIEYEIKEGDFLHVSTNLIEKFLTSPGHSVTWKNVNVSRRYVTTNTDQRNPEFIPNPEFGIL